MTNQSHLQNSNDFKSHKYQKEENKVADFRSFVFKKRIFLQSFVKDLFHVLNGDIK